MIGLIFLIMTGMAIAIATLVALLAFRVVLLVLPVLAGVAVATIAVGAGMDTTSGAVLGLIAAIAVAKRKRRIGPPRGTGRRDPARTIPQPPVPQRPAGEPALADAWARALALAPDHRARLERSRIAAADLASEADANPHDLELAEAAMLLRRHAPDLVTRAERLCRVTAAADRHACTGEMAAALDELAGVTGAFGEERRRRLHDAFATLRRHVSSRRGRGA